jgi:hypothetical protein
MRHSVSRLKVRFAGRGPNVSDTFCVWCYQVEAGAGDDARTRAQWWGIEIPSGIQAIGIDDLSPGRRAGVHRTRTSTLVPLCPPRLGWRQGMVRRLPWRTSSKVIWSKPGVARSHIVCFVAPCVEADELVPVRPVELWESTGRTDRGEPVKLIGPASRTGRGSTRSEGQPDTTAPSARTSPALPMWALLLPLVPALTLVTLRVVPAAAPPVTVTVPTPNVTVSVPTPQVNVTAPVTVVPVPSTSGGPTCTCPCLCYLNVCPSPSLPPSPSTPGDGKG